MLAYHTFINKGTGKFNDDVFDDPSFNLLHNSYLFTIQPSLNTKFWRFGIAFSKIKDFEFTPNLGRYSNNDLKYIELNAGQIQNDIWQDSNELILGSYNVKSYDGDPKINPNYIEGSKIELAIGNADKQLIFVKYNTQNVSETKRFAIIDYPYFKIFAWADNLEYRIDCSIQSYPNLNLEIDSDKNYIPNHWLLRISPDTFQTNLFNRLNAEIWYGLHDAHSKRLPDYDSFFAVKEGDKILGFDYENSKSINWIFEVTQSTKNDPVYGECIKFKIIEILSPQISLEDKKIPILLSIQFDNPINLIKIDESIYQDILGLKTIDNNRKTDFYPSFASEGYHNSTQDQLEFKGDIESFASVICLKEVKPPLAIGLFGKWGSGKSFFMEKLSESIDQKAISNKPVYIENVVQVKFNSWHYSDSNLWASLITEIFESLFNHSKGNSKNEIFNLSKSLDFTNAEKVIIEEKKIELEKQVYILKKERKEKRDRLADVSGIGLLKLIFSNKNVSQDLNELNNTNIEDIVKDTKKINSYIDYLEENRYTFKDFIKTLLSFRGKWFIVLLVAVAVFCLAFIIKNDFSIQWNLITLKVAGEISLLAAVMAQIIQTVTPFFTEVKKALSRLKSLLYQQFDLELLL